MLANNVPPPSCKKQWVGSCLLASSEYRRCPCRETIPGRDLSSLSVQGSIEALARYDRLKARLAKHGGTSRDLAILPGVTPIIGRTDAEAKKQLDRLQSWLSPTKALTLVSNRIGHDISGYPLDGPIPALPLINDNQLFSRALFDLERREKMTLRDLYNITAAARGDFVIYGTPKRIADTLEE